MLLELGHMHQDLEVGSSAEVAAATAASAAEMSSLVGSCMVEGGIGCRGIVASAAVPRGSPATLGAARPTDALAAPRWDWTRCCNWWSWLPIREACMRARSRSCRAMARHCSVAPRLASLRPLIWSAQVAHGRKWVSARGASVGLRGASAPSTAFQRRYFIEGERDGEFSVRSLYFKLVAQAEPGV